MQIQSNANLRPVYIQRILDGHYMGTGTIEHDRIKSCHKCGGAWTLKEQFGYKIHCCEKCGAFPQKLRIRKYIPSSTSDRGGRKDITHYQQKRLTDPLQALACIREIDERLLKKTFDPKEYESKEYAKSFTLSHFIENTYMPRQEAEKELGRLSPEMVRKKKGYAKNHIIPNLGHLDVRQITGPEVTKFYYKLKHLPRQMTLVTSELRVILTMALDEEMLDKLPKFPKLEQSERRDPEETKILTIEEQDKILSKIENPIYVLAIKMLCIYPIRPCDVRAIRWRDVYRNEGYITITSHFSGSERTKGRKSSKKTFRIPITSEMSEILDALPKGIGDAPLFPSPRGRFCSENNFQRAWNKAIKEADIEHVELYVGTKTAIMTDLGVDNNKEDLALVSGINEQTTTKYNLQKQSVELSRAREILERRRKK